MHTVIPYSYLVLNPIKLKKKMMSENISCINLTIPQQKRNKLSLLNNSLNNSSTCISVYSTNKQNMMDCSFSFCTPHQKLNDKNDIILNNMKINNNNNKGLNRNIFLKPILCSRSRQEQNKDIYKDIFRDKCKVFDYKKRSQTINNLLNIQYAENFEQLKLLQDKKRTKDKNYLYKSLSNCNLNPLTNSNKKLSKIKNSLSFVKCIFDYSYPEVYLTKNKCLSKDKEIRKQIKLKPKIADLEEQVKKIEYQKYKFLKVALNIKKIKV